VISGVANSKRLRCSLQQLRDRHPRDKVTR